MKKAMLGTALAIAAITAQAATQQNVESSAVVNGTIVLAKDGTVQTAAIDNPAKYGQPIADMVRKAAMQWRFQPVLRDGQPVVAKASMHARVVLKQMPDGNYNAHIKGVTFGDYDSNDTDTLHNAESNKRIPPHYPEAAILAHVQGTVYLALRVDHSGHVTDAVAEQVNLGNIGRDNLLKEYRDILADAALRAARHWTYTVPTTGRLARQDSWTVHVPATFSMKENGVAEFDSGVWHAYVPGPYTPAPWVNKPDAGAADALASGDLQTDGAGPTPLPASNNHG
ncbi:energy transducer TonB [Rhodanobacter sp. Si-c]|uniref:Energy transducer TonB n=1 Tax=Rhodanobacter lycopersici TaxID=3162487 RepID=A0ABV3QGR7_9GAMM